MNSKVLIEECLNGLLQQGFTLIRGSWGSFEKKTCCPLSSVKLSEIKSERDAAKALGVSVSWINAFLAGYDDLQAHPAKSKHQEAYNLGVYFRTKYTPKEYWLLERD